MFPPLPALRDVCQHVEADMIVVTGKGVQLHLLCRVQGCCYTPYKAENGPPTVQNYLALNVTSAEVKKSSLT